MAVALRQVVDDREREVREHHRNQHAQPHAHPVGLCWVSAGHVWGGAHRRLDVSCASLISHELQPRLLLLRQDEVVHALANDRHVHRLLYDRLECGLAHQQHHEEGLQVRLDDGLADRRGAKERQEGDLQRMMAKCIYQCSKRQSARR